MISLLADHSLKQKFSNYLKTTINDSKLSFKDTNTFVD